MISLSPKIFFLILDNKQPLTVLKTRQQTIVREDCMIVAPKCRQARSFKIECEQNTKHYICTLTIGSIGQ